MAFTAMNSKYSVTLVIQASFHVNGFNGLRGRHTQTRAHILASRTKACVLVKYNN